VVRELEEIRILSQGETIHQNFVNGVNLLCCTNPSVAVSLCIITGRRCKSQLNCSALILIQIQIDNVNSLVSYPPLSAVLETRICGDYVMLPSIVCLLRIDGDSVKSFFAIQANMDIFLFSGVA
jgi:hypothetical protein